MDRGNSGSSGERTTDNAPEDDAESPVAADHWVRRGEYLIGVHNVPRTTFFSPSHWLHESGAKRIGIENFTEDKFGLFPDYYDIEQLEVCRETKPDNKSLGDYWDTW